MTSHQRECPLLPPDSLQFWQTLHPHPQYGFFLGSATGRDRYVYMSAGEPQKIFASLASLGGAFKKMSRGNRPRFVGLLTFEEGRVFDPGLQRLPKRPDPIGMPHTFFGDYSRVVKLDFEKGTTTFYSEYGEEDLDRMSLALSSRYNQLSTEKREKKRAALSRPPFKPFQRMVRQAQEAIRRGDIYQANLSLRFSSYYRGDPLLLYRRLCENNPSPYAGIWKTPSSWVVSNSPELLVRVENKVVVTRPIAGTRPRGGTEMMDRKRSGQLLLSPKERAEHIMLVDLERNDLGRVCQAGSVTVTDRYAIEKYSHVMHIVSEVRGRIKKGANAMDVLRATFPGGTITGCPKIKSVEIIEALEKNARGIFYGSGGFFRANGDATFNILIRTAFVKGQRLYIQAGAGIVADSHPRREYNEVLAKAQALREAVENS